MDGKGTEEPTGVDVKDNGEIPNGEEDGEAQIGDTVEVKKEPDSEQVIESAKVVADDSVEISQQDREEIE